MTSFGYHRAKYHKKLKEIKDTLQEVKEVESVPSPAFQTHVHEFLGSTMLAGPAGLIHNHRVAGVTSEVIPVGDDHIHGFFVNTDFVFEHLHELTGVTGLSIPVGNGRHVHFVDAITTLNRGHVHNIIFATLLDNPIG